MDARGRFGWLLLIGVVVSFQVGVREAVGDVRVAKVFGDGMVLQRDWPIKVWGWGDVGERVTVSFGGEEVKGVVGKDGRWMVELGKRKADGKKHVMVVEGRNRIVFKDVVMGEVWLAVGQSNMSRGLRYVKKRVMGEKMDFDGLRLLMVQPTLVPEKEEVKELIGWAKARHESMRKVFVHPRVGTYEYSEVSYYFGKRLHEKLGVPVGVIVAAYGGTTVAEWTRASGKGLKQFEFGSRKKKRGAGALYQSMMVGLAPFGVKGAIWYQGENDGRNKKYGVMMKKMVEGWSEVWGRELAFHMAQVSQTTYAGGMLNVWEGEAWLVGARKGVGLAASNDLWDGGNASNLKRVDKGKRGKGGTGWPIAGGGNPHPPNKHLMGMRLGDVALDVTYGFLEGESFGPMVEGVKRVDEGKVRVRFKYVGNGLRTEDGKAPNWFEVFDGKEWVKGRAKIVGKDVVEVVGEGGGRVEEVRFGWRALARHNLYNSEGLAAMPFGGRGVSDVKVNSKDK